MENLCAEESSVSSISETHDRREMKDAILDCRVGSARLTFSVQVTMNSHCEKVAAYVRKRVLAPDMYYDPHGRLSLGECAVPKRLKAEIQIARRHMGDATPSENEKHVGACILPRRLAERCIEDEYAIIAGEA